ncbi:MAG: ketoacyl-ACP synthase III [Myxococcales bacterium]|nr:ketoacyl-ACP synthase III [Myxococcales bacterium]
MATVRVENVAVRGIVSAVPDREKTWEQDAEQFGVEEMQRVIKNLGVTRRCVAEHLSTADLCQASAENLIAKLGWDKASIDVLILVTQTPDYPSPATACLVQNRMGLPTSVIAFDINLGCSGYTYGLMVAASMLAGGKLKRAILLAGDTIGRCASPFDRATVPLFGDGGSATALEVSPNAAPIVFEGGTDGAGGIHLHTVAGGAKHPTRPSDHDLTLRRDGVMRSNLHTYMNGAEVLTFAIQSVPAMVNSVVKAAGWSEPEIDGYLFHQASRFMLRNIGRLLRLPPNSPKLVMALEGYGNTSSASIPVAMNDQLEGLNDAPKRLVLAGFGIGWSWCAAAVQLGPLYLPPVLRVPDEPRIGEFERMKEHEVSQPGDLPLHASADGT